MQTTRGKNKIPNLNGVLRWFDSLPPFFIYYVAAHNYRNGKRRRRHQSTSPSRTTIQELAAISGIPSRTFCRIAKKLSWDDVKVKHIAPFCKACGVNFEKNKHLRHYVRTTLQQRRMYAHLNAQQLRQFTLLAERRLKMEEDRQINQAAA